MQDNQDLIIQYPEEFVLCECCDTILHKKYATNLCPFCHGYRFINSIEDIINKRLSNLINPIPRFYISDRIIFDI